MAKTYQWRRNGSNISGATSAVYTKTAVVGDAGVYDVVVSENGASRVFTLGTLSVEADSGAATFDSTQITFDSTERTFDEAA